MAKGPVAKMSLAIFVVEMFDAICADGSVVDGKLTAVQFFRVDMEKVSQVEFDKTDSKVVGRLNVDDDWRLVVEVGGKIF